METGTPKRPWDQRLQQAASGVEDELRRVLTYLNDEVVPEVRQNGSVALRKAAAELERLARAMDDHAARADRSAPRPDSSRP